MIPRSAKPLVDELREYIAVLHAELVRYGLVVWTAGNVSARVPGHDLMVIKPSGVSYDDLTPGVMVVCDCTCTRKPTCRCRGPRSTWTS